MPLHHRLGSLELAVLSDGTLFLDAGAVFGLVPRLMWEAHAGALDASYRMALGLNCLLVRSGGKLVLIETGVGDKPGGARRTATPVAAGTLISELAAMDLRPEDIDIVINTHLHFDHCGWNTRLIDDALGLTFPNAEYVITRREWEDANDPNERTRATYLAENLDPLRDSSHLRLIDGEQRITDEITIVPTPGHTQGHASVVISSGGETAVYIGDMAQAVVQIERTAWVSAFDVLPLVSLETKKAVFERAIAEQSLLVSVHAPFPGLGRLVRHGNYRRWVAEDALPSP